MAALQDCGIDFPYLQQPWYGEPPDAVRDEFAKAELMQLDAMTDERASEPLSQRLWRRYGLNAIELLDQIRQDPRQAEILIQRSVPALQLRTMWLKKVCTPNWKIFYAADRKYLKWCGEKPLRIRQGY